MDLAWTALALGFMGSLHCVGMCGPIALALPYQADSRWRTTGNVLLYNSGRVVSYGIIGLVPGLLGLGVSMAGQQKALSVLVGVFFILSALLPLSGYGTAFQVPFLNKTGRYAQDKLRRLMGQRGGRTFFAVGFLNGFLPCGLVYMALAGALLRESLPASVGYMMLFGLGTVPLMAAVAGLRRIISAKVRNKLRRVVPFFLFLMGIYFIIRGVNSHLPVNVANWLENGTPVMCH